jgi:DNA-binding transcriptional MerR regulator
VREDEAAIPTAAKDKTDPLLSIGVFSRRSRLSPKALRLYERLGVLIPAHVNSENGYRRYRESQLATARLVAMLRRLDMPLAQVAQVVAAVGPHGAEMAMRHRLRRSPEPDATAAGQAGAALLASYWDSVERRVASQRELVAHLRIRLLGEEGSFGVSEIREREVPAQLVLTEQRHTTVEALSSWIEDATMRLWKTADNHGGVVGPMFVVYHGEVNQDSDGPVEVCLPIGLGQDGATDAATRTEPAHREAYLRITKAQVAFPQILSAYDAVAQWLNEQGRNPSGPPREVYFADWDAAGPTDEVCDIAFPVA